MNRRVLLGCLLAAAANVARGASPYDAELYTQVELFDLNDRNRGQVLADVRAAGIGTVLISFADFFEEGEARRPALARLTREMRFFETNGIPTLVWINGFGYGNERTGTAARRLAKSVRLTDFEGNTTGAVCPTDPVICDAIAENVRDVAKAGAKFILMDDEFLQSVRPGLGCVCSNHLALVSARVGRPVTSADVRDSFTGRPNALRTAFLDVSGKLVTDLARRLRRELDGVDPSVGMGICASYTHYDVEGTDMDELIDAFAGPTAPRLYRISGAPYWRNGRYGGSELDGTLEFVRLQSAWYRHRGYPVLDENDPSPRRVSVIPAYLCELYDKAVIADGGLRRHKYMLCYGPDRCDTGYLDAHLANQADDVVLKRIFAGTESTGVRVLFRQHAIREAELPTPYAGDWKLMGAYSHPLAGHFLVRNGIPCRYEGEGPSIAFGNAAHEIGPKEIARGVIVDREATEILRQKGVDTTSDRFCVLDVNGYDLNFGTYPTGRHRRQVVEALRRFTGNDVPVYVETDAPRIYQIVARDPKDGSYAVLLENLEDKPADVVVRTVGTARIDIQLHGAFAETEQGLSLRSMPPHEFAAVRFNTRRRERKNEMPSESPCRRPGDRRLGNVEGR